MTDYRYIFGSLISEAVVDEIPLYGVYLTNEINVGGEFQGTFKLDVTGKSNETMLSATVPGKCWVACERNGVAIWHGFVWSRVYSAQSKSVQLFCQSFENYPDKQRILTDTTFTDTEQRNIFRQLWIDMQAVPGRNMNVNIPGAFVDSNLKSIEVLATDNKYYGNVMGSLANSDDGFDWYIGVSKDGTFYRKDLLIGTPNLGTNPFAGMVVYEYPGNITQYYFTESMADAGTHVQILGKGEGSTMVKGVYSDDAMVAGGFPRWDVDISRKDIEDQSVIDGIAAQEGINRRPPMPIIKITVKADKPPEFGTVNLGDTVGIVIKDPRFPGNGIDLRKRLFRWELHPSSSEKTEEANYLFEGDSDV